MADAFDPTREVIPTPGFGRRIEELQTAGRYRTAIEEVFKVLDRDPGNQEALFLAANILGTSRTQQITAAEPLSDRYTNDRRLNPIWAICQKCERGWVPSSVQLGSVFGAHQMHVMNPVGQQCPKCGYTLCHLCLKENPIGVGYSFYSHPCPNGCGVDLSVPVHPTGRRNVQFGRRPQPVTHVYVFREGPIKPDATYLRNFLEARSPDVFESRPIINAVAVGTWPESLEMYTISYLLASGLDQDAVLASETGTIIDDDGSKVHLIKVYAAK